MTFSKALLATMILLSASGAIAYGGLHLPRKEGADLAPDAGRDTLRQVVQNECLVNWREHHNPSPCERVLAPAAQSNASGYAILADRKGGAHYLLIPTQTMAGTESAELLDPDLPNYFAEAWRARDLITAFVGKAVPRTAIGLAVNTVQTREQNQFHIHIECLRQDVADVLRDAGERITETWAPLRVGGSTYQAMRIANTTLDSSNPFELLARLNADARHRMGAYTLLVAGMLFKDGAGFVVLTNTGPTAELMLDSTCAVAGGGGRH